MDHNQSNDAPVVTPASTNKNKINVALDLRIICLLLLAALIASLALWRPWENTNSASDRTISVSGEATLKETPDEYTFNPMYQFDTNTKEEAITNLTAKSNEVIAGLKKLGVSEEKIKSESNGYENPSFQQFGGSKVSYSLNLTVTINDEKLVQEVQDYLVSTAPTGSVSPNATFSETTRKSLESKGRSAAVTDARKRADQMASELGFKVTEVKSVSDGEQQNGGIFPIDARVMQSAPAETSAGQIDVQVGQNELKYAVKVVYYIK